MYLVAGCHSRISGCPPPQRPAFSSSTFSGSVGGASCSSTDSPSAQPQATYRPLPNSPQMTPGLPLCRAGARTRPCGPGSNSMRFRRRPARGWSSQQQDGYNREVTIFHHFLPLCSLLHFFFPWPGFLPRPARLLLHLSLLTFLFLVFFLAIFLSFTNGNRDLKPEFRRNEPQATILSVR